MVPPVSDEVQLTVDEYRSRLYEVKNISPHFTFLQHTQTHYNADKLSQLIFSVLMSA